jgi:hypothetical protein
MPALSLANHENPLNPSVAVKKLVRAVSCHSGLDPESSVFIILQILWTPVFTGETIKILFFHTFPFSKREVSSLS